MDKKRILHSIEWIVALSACGYLVWKIATYDDYASLSACLRGMGWREWGALVLCVALMPVNMTLEAWRWRTLVPMSWCEAHRQVYYSKLAAVWRVPCAGIAARRMGTDAVHGSGRQCHDDGSDCDSGSSSDDNG